MTDVTASSLALQVPLANRPARSLAGERLFGGLVTGSGVIVLGLMGAIILMLAVGAWPAFRTFGVPFFWNPVWIR